MNRIMTALSLMIAAGLVIGADAEPDWQHDLATAQRLARQTDRPIFAVLH